MKFIFSKTAAFLVLVMIFSFFTGCFAEKKPAEPNTLLINYYEKFSEGEAFELVLYSTKDPEFVKLSEFVTENGEETRTDYLVPYKAAKDCYEIIKKYDFAGWEGRNDLVSLDGIKIVCKFFDGKKLVRVSSEEMPEDGEKQIKEIKEIILGYKASAEEA